ncbi:MAG: Ig-like domain-containing protein [Clostridia bacterium]|nr:Ig-like domain-containing protein [Clostridia bacterium]
MTKRVLAFLMCAVMIFSSVPFTPGAGIFDFAFSAVAAENVFEVFFDSIPVLVNSEAVLNPVATFNGETVTENLTYKWTSRNTSVVTVDENGRVKGIKAGEATVSLYAVYTYMGIDYTYTYGSKITVNDFIPVESLTPVGSSSVSILEKRTQTLKVTVGDATATQKNLSWVSSDESIVTITDTGVYTNNPQAYAEIKALKAGTATVTYTTTDGTNKSGAFTVTVKPLVKAISLPPFVVISPSSTGYAINYKITPSDALIQALDWDSGNENVCTVDARGVVKPGSSKQPGVCEVTAKATDGGPANAFTTVVVSAGTDSLTLSETSLSMKVNDKQNLDAWGVLSGTDNIRYKDAVTWISSNKNVATVDALGIITAVGPGKATITATTADGSNLSVSCAVDVIQPVKGVSLPASQVCSVNGTLRLIPVFDPVNASNQQVTWTTDDPDIATVSDTGLVTGKKVGNVFITVKTKDGGHEAKCLIKVENLPESVSLSTSSIGLRAGDSVDGTFTLKATVNPEGATNKSVTWTSSNKSVVTVDANGRLTAVAGGTATVTCTTNSGGKTATCKVTVSEDAESIEIINAPTELFVTKNHSVGIRFNSSTVTNKEIAWSSSNPGVIEVDRNGMLTARAKGSSVIKATYVRYDNKVLEDECTVFVYDKIDVTGVTIDNGEKVYSRYDTPLQMYASVEPYEASDKTVLWSLENSGSGVALIDRYKGLLTPEKAGVVKVVAKSNDKSNIQDTCMVYFLEPFNFYSSTTNVPVGSTAPLSFKTNKNPLKISEYTWKSSDTSVATVNSSGEVKGIKAGSVIITATTPDGIFSAACKVNVVIPVTGVKITPTNVIVPLGIDGSQRSVAATVSPKNATDQKVTWSTPSQSFPIIEVSATGQITGRRVGSTTLTVTTNDGKYTDTINVKVIQPVKSIAFDYSSITLEAKKKKTLTPHITPLSATDKTVKWSTSNKNVATVDQNGVVTAVSAGTATVTCTSADGYAKETVKVTVTQPPTGIKFNAKKVTVKIGTPKKLNPKVLPETAANKNIIFKSSDEKIAKVSDDGVVTGVKKGTVKITATTYNSLYSATIKVVVVKPVKSVKLNKTSVSIAVGKTTLLTPTVSPKSADNKDVKWKSSDNDVVTVKNGKITAKAPGYAVVTCTTVDGGKTAECTVFVNQPVKSVKLNKTKAIMDINDKLTLKATIKPSDASNKAVKWSSSNKKVVKVTSKGVLKPVSTGTATITVTTLDGNLKATCKVTVVKRVKSVTLPKTLTVYLGEKDTLKAVLNPSKPSNPDVKWKSSKKSVATVSKTGKITPKKTGTANITITTDDGGLTATCKVSVKRKLKSFTLNKKSVTLNTGATFALTAKRKPANATEGITYTSSNKKVVTVNSKGVITAVSRGTATITAKSERGITVKCKVTVKQPVNSMYISRNTASVYMGESLKLIANVLPKNANNQSFTWSSSNVSVAAVNGGTVTPKKVGTAVITVKSANGKTASCTVTVKQHVNAISLDKTAVSLEAGNTAALKVTVSPANATEKGYTFTSSNTAVATVSSAGVITAKTPGTATVTVRSKENNKTATCKVTVIQRVIGVELNTTAETLYVDKYFVGETLQLKATVLPADATDKTVIWTSSDSSVAKVSSSGTVTAVKSGVALITATTKDGNKTVSCSVTVLQNVSAVTLENAQLTVNRGESVLLDAVVEPADAFNKNVVWTFENEEIVTVDEYGWLTGVNCGKTTVKATTVDGGLSATCLVTVNEPVTDVKLDITEVPSLYRDETVKLTPTVYPDFITEYINKDVIWSSSDENIAKVSRDGTVTAVGAGEVIITATTVDGGFEAQCKVICFIPVEEITTQTDDFYIKIGAEHVYEIKPVVLPENASKPELSWSVLSGEEYFTCENGVITGLSMGSGRIRITSIDNPAVTKDVNVHIIEKVTGVTLDKTEVTLNKGETSVLVPTVSPSVAHNKNVSFASDDESVVTVSEDGVVTAVGRGTAKVTVTTEDEGKTAECIFNVKQLAEEIVFSADEYTVGAGKKITLDVNVLPENTNDKTLKWESSETSVATVANGIVTGINVGETLITATATDAGTVSKAVRVTVVRHAESIELTADTDSLWVGDSINLNTFVLPQDTTDKTVAFTSSDESIATVDSDGKVTAVSAGETGTADVVIKAVSACGSAESEFAFTVRQQITDIVIPETELVLELGDTYTFEPTVLPGNAFDKTVTYISSDSEVLTVENGTVITAGTGTATVTLKSACGKVEKECAVKVIVLPAGIDMEKEIPLEKTKQYQLTPVFSPENVTETGLTFTSSSEEVATVDEKGLITAHKAGTAVIRAQSEVEDVFAECIVTVYVLSEKIELTCEKYELYIGEEFTLGAAVLPEDTTDKTVTFASGNNDVITVDNEGKVKAVGKGTAKVIVTAEDTGITAECEVTVRKHVESITVAEDAVAYVGRPMKLTADVAPADADNKNIIWTVNDTRTASVDADGLFTAHEKGFVLVTAETEDGGFTASCFVEIKTGIDSVSFDKETLILDRGASETLNFSVLPVNADDKEVIWTTSDDTVAFVDENGKVTATEKSGIATIRATAIDNPEAYAECTVTVKVPLEAIYPQKSYIDLRKGETEQITVVYRPSEATVKDVIFRSEDSEIASVDENGIVTAHKPGEVKIIITSPEGVAAAECTVKVYRELENITSLPLTVNKGSQMSCRIQAIPENHDETLLFSSDNENVASVDENGLITAKAAGTANITVKGNKSGVSDTFTVTVIEPVTGVEFDADEVFVQKNGMTRVTFKVLPADAGNIVSIEVTSDNEEIAAIMDKEKGTVQGIQVGTAEITVTVITDDGIFTDTCTLTVLEAETE